LLSGVAFPLLVIFRKQACSTLISGSGNSRLVLAPPGDAYIKMRVRQFSSSPFRIWGKRKAGDHFQISCFVMPRIGGGYLIFNVY
jgi:hypothetical protein